MASTADYVRFLADPDNKSYAKDIIEFVVDDYDNSQDLVSYGKRAIQVDKKANVNSALLLETTMNELDEEELIEPTFVVAGIMVQSSLPPIRSKSQLPDAALSATQEVSIIVADEEQFNNTVTAIEDIHTMFSHEFASGALKNIEHESYEGETVLTFGTRYFTPTHICKSETSEKLPHNVDPLGILAKAVGGRGKYLHDNMVRYHQHTTTNGSPKWITMEPSRFRAGQVVQLEVAFRVVPSKPKSTYRMVPLIRSIALLDSELYLMWQQKTRTTKVISTPRVRIKRSTAYDTEDASEFAARPSKRAKPDQAEAYNDEGDDAEGAGINRNGAGGQEAGEPTQGGEEQGGEDEMNT